MRRCDISGCALDPSHSCSRYSCVSPVRNAHADPRLVVAQTIAFKRDVRACFGLGRDKHDKVYCVIFLFFIPLIPAPRGSFRLSIHHPHTHNSDNTPPLLTEPVATVPLHRVAPMPLRPSFKRKCLLPPGDGNKLNGKQHFSRCTIRVAIEDGPLVVRIQ
jgi:hypothetical protein